MANDLTEKLAAAQLRAERARRSLASLRTRIDGENRRRRTQRLCTVGAAMEAWCDENAALLPPFKAFLGRYLTRDADVQILRGTPFETVPAESGETSNG